MTDKEFPNFFHRPLPDHLTREQRAKVLADEELLLRADLKRWPTPKALYKFRPCEGPHLGGPKLAPKIVGLPNR